MTKKTLGVDRSRSEHALTDGYTLGWDTTQILFPMHTCSSSKEGEIRIISPMGVGSDGSGARKGWGDGVRRRWQASSVACDGAYLRQEEDEQLGCQVPKWRPSSFEAVTDNIRKPVEKVRKHIQLSGRCL